MSGLRWPAVPIWEGKDCVVLGTGKSLRSLDPSLLWNWKVIGCNEAYRLGEAACSVCFFNEADWYRANQGIRQFNNPVVHTVTTLAEEVDLFYLPSGGAGWPRGSLGANAHVEVEAVHLALLAGASKVYLLGFDDPRDYGVCLVDWAFNWPGIQIINLTAGSGLVHFPAQDVRTTLLRRFT